MSHTPPCSILQTDLQLIRLSITPQQGLLPSLVSSPPCTFSSTALDTLIKIFDISLSLT
jgi:hypothetical protein